jgi:signal transduction histidine kinase
MKPAPPVTKRRTQTSVPTASSSEAALLRTELDQLRLELDEHVRLNAVLSDSAEQFIGALAHDVKNPLAAIKINVQGLKRNLERGSGLDPGQIAERLTRIEEAINQALEQLALARVRVSATTAFHKQPRRQPLDLVSLVREMVARLQKEAGQQRLRLACKCPTLVGAWDEVHLRQALGAILDNALKFSGPDGKTVITVRRTGDEAEVSVADLGIGIPERDLAHVCERFYRAENVLGRYKGSGLGLFEAQAAIAGHKGGLAIVSREHHGSTFTVRLPLHD